VLTITDEGPGITREHRARIFDRFYRVDEGRSREMGPLDRGIRRSKTQAKSACGRKPIQ
jgi:Signal transduction histidine kinase